MFLLSKLLPLFVLPLGLSLILIGWGALRRRPRFVVAGVCLLFVASLPPVAGSLWRVVEGHAERPPASAMPAADAIVVLSEGRIMPPGRESTIEWVDSDRFFGGLELFDAGKAPLLVFTGAPDLSGRDPRTEGDYLAALAVRLDVPPASIVVTGRVLNTADEARQARAALASQGLVSPRILLVTSAFHMPRATEIFAREGFHVTPFPVDFADASPGISALDFVPNASALRVTSAALRELYGRAYYWLLSLR